MRSVLGARLSWTPYRVTATAHNTTEWT